MIKTMDTLDHLSKVTICLENLKQSIYEYNETQNLGTIRDVIESIAVLQRLGVRTPKLVELELKFKIVHEDLWKPTPRSQS